MVMGETAEVLAEHYKISREEQDEYALMSQTRAARAMAAGRFDAELVPVTLEGKKGATTFNRDEHPFANASLEKLGNLAPVFSKTGTVHGRKFLGNYRRRCRGDCSERTFRQEKQPEAAGPNFCGNLGRSGSAPHGIGPVRDAHKLEEKHNLRLHDFGLIELNEAFAGQVLACDRELNFNRDKLNVNGGSRSRSVIPSAAPVHESPVTCVARDAEAEYGAARRSYSLRERRNGYGAGAGERDVSPMHPPRISCFRVLGFPASIVLAPKRNFPLKSSTCKNRPGHPGQDPLRQRSNADRTARRPSRWPRRGLHAFRHSDLDRPAEPAAWGYEDARHNRKASP